MMRLLGSLVLVPLLVTATAYTQFDPTMDGLGITFMGTKVKEHQTIAVDPHIIPLGSNVYIPSRGGLPNRGIYRAEDTGGAIKGARIDIFIPELGRAMEFGVQRLRVYLPVKCYPEILFLFP